MTWMAPAWTQKTSSNQKEKSGWEHTREILRCAPVLVDRRDLVEDNFNHSYVTNNPRDIEVGYFSVEPVTYFEEGKRVCEATLPAAGVSQTRFRGTYETSYTLPGDGVYRITMESNALVFTNDLRVISAQNTVARIDASHRLEIEVDSLVNPPSNGELNSVTQSAYSWEIEFDEKGSWKAEIISNEISLNDRNIPSGISTMYKSMDLAGPGTVVIRESVIFDINSLSAYKYDPIFQAACLFSLEPVSVSAKLLPCGK
jgi:hypothetical protein